MEVYRAESALIMEILRSITPLVERMSVDEAYLDVSEMGDAVALAREIKRRIKEERGLTSSIGVSCNKFLAKLGSGFQKPNGLTVIRDEDKVEFLKPLPVGSIHGVGPVTAQALQAKGIQTIGDLQNTNLDLEPVVGSFAGTLKQRAIGIDDRPVDLSDERKSISAETTFLTDTDHRPTLRAALKEMAADVAQTLDAEGVAALTVQVKVRYSDFTTFTRQIRLQEPATTAVEIYHLACFLLAKNQLVKRPLRLLGIGLSSLVPPTRDQFLLPL
jgi:DNA polymerase-4